MKWIAYAVVALILASAMPAWAHPGHFPGEATSRKNHARYLHEVALHAAEAGHLHEALMRIVDALKLHPDHPEYRFTRGMIRIDLGDLDGGREDLEFVKSNSEGLLRLRARRELLRLDERIEHARLHRRSPTSARSRAHAGSGGQRRAGSAGHRGGTGSVKGATQSPAPRGQGAATEASGSLYERLGGEPAIRAVVVKAQELISTDPRIKDFFLDTQGSALADALVSQIGEATGGPQQYLGADMQLAHEGLGISNADFDAFVEDFVAAMDALSVPKKEQRELLAILAPMREDIVETP